MNNEILIQLSGFLNNHDKSITKDLIHSVSSCGVTEEEAYKMLLSSFLGFDDNKEFLNEYLPYMVKELNPAEYKMDSYYQHIKFRDVKYKDWELKHERYSPYQAFVYDDFLYRENRVIPRIGYFKDGFRYPGVYYKERLWMSITPNEINTMKEPINKAYGDVLTFGLGLGYFSYMCSLKGDVKSVTIIEKDRDVIDLFNKYILNQFEFKDKIHIIHDDAYHYLDMMEDSTYDYVFVDIYHDASDGKETCLQFKKYEEKLKNTRFEYWIYNTIKYYL